MTSAKCDTQGLGFTLLLGTDYENKKKQLLQELQLEYKEYLNKKKDVKNCEPRLLHQGLSLPIDERILAKERLREKRNQEYNAFLQEQADIRKLRRGVHSFASKPEQIKMSDDANSTSQGPLFSINTDTNIPPPHKELPMGREDAAIQTEDTENGGSTGGQNPWMRKRWNVCRPKEPESPSEELNTDDEEILDFKTRRRRRHIQDHEYQNERKAHECYVDRAFKDKADVEASAVHHENNNERILKSSTQMEDRMKTAVRSTFDTNKNNTHFATGLMIGRTEEQSVTQMRKEQYRQELLRQIAEQQRNKMKEKKLDLRVAATGVTDPEKETDRIKQFGAAHKPYATSCLDDPCRPRRYLDPNARPQNDKPSENSEQGVALGKFKADFSTALSQLPRNTTMPGTGRVQDAPPLDYSSEDHYKDFTSIQGETAIPRVAAVALPAPPIVPNTSKIQCDDSYYYYGTRDPVDPNTPQNQIQCLHGGAQQSGNCDIPHQMSPSFRASGCTEVSPFGFERHLFDTSKQRRGSVLNYQEALRQQMKEREECKRKEKEEKKRFDAKLEAEMIAYNPWGRGGAGAPIKDQNGNLVSDLNQMRKINNCNMYSPGAETGTFFSHQLSDFRHQSPQQQHQTQNRYKEELKQQIEEKKRKQAEERERLKILEEEEERRVAKERARMWEEFEEERRKQNTHCVTSRHQSTLQQHQTQNEYKEDLKQQIEEKRRKQAEEQERMKMADEEEERRVAQERARIQQELEKKRSPEKENCYPSRHQSPLWQEQTQNWYKEDLKQQIEEKRGKQAEEQERMKIAEEEEERRDVKERAHIQQKLEMKRTQEKENCFSSRHQSPLWQEQTQNRYKEDLKEQIVEKRRKKAEAQERMKIADEEEDRRVAKERAHIQQDLEKKRGHEKENCFPSRHQSPLWQEQMQNRYKEDLKQQIEEKRGKKAEAQERMKIAVEEEERRDVKERAHIQQKLEKKRTQEKENCFSSRHQSPLWQEQTQNWYKEDLKQQIEEKRRKQAEEQERMKIAEEKEERREVKERAHRQQKLEKKRTQEKENCFSSRHQSPLWQEETQNWYKEDLKQQREPTPPTPSLQTKQENVGTSRHPSSRADPSVSAPHDTPVTKRNPTLNAVRQDVIKELAAIRKRLRKRQRQLERQISQMNPQETSCVPSNRFRIAQQVEPTVPAAEPDSKPRSIISYGRRPRVDAFDSATKQAVRSPRKCHFLIPARVNKGSSQLQNRDGSSGDIDEKRGSRQPSAQRTASLRSLPYESEEESHSDNQSLGSFEVESLNNQHIMRRHPHHGDRNRKPGLADDEVDVSSLHSALGRSVSVETVATEPWLRPGTSDAANNAERSQTAAWMLNPG